MRNREATCRSELYGRLNSRVETNLIMTRAVRCVAPQCRMHRTAIVGFRKWACMRTRIRKLVNIWHLPDGATTSVRPPDPPAPLLLPPLPTPPLLAQVRRERSRSPSLTPTIAPCHDVSWGVLAPALPPFSSSFSPARCASSRPSHERDSRLPRRVAASREGIGGMGTIGPRQARGQSIDMGGLFTFSTLNISLTQCKREVKRSEPTST